MLTMMPGGQKTYVFRYGRRGFGILAGAFFLIGLSAMVNAVVIVCWTALWGVCGWRVHHGSRLRFGRNGVVFASIWRPDRHVQWANFVRFEPVESRQAPGISVMVGLRTSNGQVWKSAPMSVLRGRAAEVCESLNTLAQGWGHCGSDRVE